MHNNDTRGASKARWIGTAAAAVIGLRVGMAQASESPASTSRRWIHAMASSIRVATSKSNAYEKNLAFFNSKLSRRSC